MHRLMFLLGKVESNFFQKNSSILVNMYDSFIYREFFEIFVKNRNVEINYLLLLSFKMGS